MDFESLDGYLLDGSPQKADVVRDLLQRRPGAVGAAPFYEGMELLGARTPDLTLIAVRLVLAGKKPDDATMARARDLVALARTGDVTARTQLRDLFRPA